MKIVGRIKNIHPNSQNPQLELTFARRDCHFLRQGKKVEIAFVISGTRWHGTINTTHSRPYVHASLWNDDGTKISCTELFQSSQLVDGTEREFELEPDGSLRMQKKLAPAMKRSTRSLPNLDDKLYRKFKKEGYRIKTYRTKPVKILSELVQLGYLDVNRTLTGIRPVQSSALKRAVMSFIENFLADSPTNQDTFDELHHDCCQRCLSCSSMDGAKVHYGQAQKILNMSLKYLHNEYAVDKDELNRFGYPENGSECYFHLPVDGQIREALTGNYHFTDPTHLPWSKWNYEHYLSFQSQLRARIKRNYYPLEIDYWLWNTDGQSSQVATALR